MVSVDSYASVTSAKPLAPDSHLNLHRKKLISFNSDAFSSLPFHFYIQPQEAVDASRDTPPSLQRSWSMYKNQRSTTICKGLSYVCTIMQAHCMDDPDLAAAIAASLDELRSHPSHYATSASQANNREARKGCLSEGNVARTSSPRNGTHNSTFASSPATTLSSKQGPASARAAESNTITAVMDSLGSKHVANSMARGVGDVSQLSEQPVCGAGTEGDPCELCVRLPDNQRISRVFGLDNRIGDVIMWIQGCGWDMRRHRICLVYPRTPLVDTSITLRAAGITSRRESVVLEVAR
jgi:hypothetical protein